MAHILYYIILVINIIYIDTFVNVFLIVLDNLTIDIPDNMVKVNSNSYLFHYTFSCLSLCYIGLQTTPYALSMESWALWTSAATEEYNPSSWLSS